MPLLTCNPHITKEQDVHCQSSVANCGLAAAGKTMMGSLCHCSTCPLPATAFPRTEDNGEEEESDDDVCARMRAAIEENLTIVNSDVLSCRVASLRCSNPAPNPAEKYTSSSAAATANNNGPCLSPSHPPCIDPKMTAAFQSSKSLGRLKPFVPVRSRFSHLRWWVIALSLLLVAAVVSPTAEARSLPRRSDELSTNPSSNSTTSSNAPAPSDDHQQHPAQDEDRGLVSESEDDEAEVLTTIRQPNKRSAKKVTRLGKRKGGKNGSKKTHKKGKKGKKHRKSRKGKRGKGGKRRKCNRKNKKKGKKGKKCRTPHDPRTPTATMETTTQPETTAASKSSSKMSAGSSQNSPRTERLYNKQGTAFHLAVMTNGKVFGEEAKIRSNYSLIDVRSVEKGFVTLKGKMAQLFICVTDKGRVVGRRKYIKAFCQFREGIELNKQNTYQSLFPCGDNATCSGFLNISKNGRVRPVINVERESQYAHFLPLLRNHNSKRKRRQAGKRRNRFTLTPADLQSIGRHGAASGSDGATEFLLTVTEPEDTEERVPTTTISNDE